MTGKKKTMKTQDVFLGKEILVNVSPVEKRIAILEKNELVDFFMERASGEACAGSIFKGKVTSILPGIEAAFVDIGLNKNGFLHVDDVIDNSYALKELLKEEEAPERKKVRTKKSPKIENILKKNEEIMVQVIKEAIGTKGPRLTTYISLPGRYLVLTPYDDNIGISRRITDKEERKRIRDIITKIGFPKNMGCIIRTVAENRTEKEFKSELNYLMNLWSKIQDRYQKQKAPVRVYEEYGIVLRMIRDIFGEDIDRLVIDSKEEYGRIIKFLKVLMPKLKSKIKVYNGKIPLFQKYNLDKKISEIFERKVALDNGGSLVIEQTEGVVVIDVNTGSFIGKKSLEETVYRTNLEAAKEIPRQLLLRDVGGIVIIDFIDMEKKDHRDKIFNVLQQNLHKDKARISVRSISQFGIVEMTRQRMRKSLEGSSHVECPYCGGKGAIKSIETIAIEVVRKIDTLLSSDTKKKSIKACLHPDINDALVSDQAKMLGEIQRKYRCKIELKVDKSLHIEDIVIDCL